MKFTNSTAKSFRNDFQLAIAKLEKQYECSINLGNIRFNANELRSKLTATKTSAPSAFEISSKFTIGETVRIDHKRCSGKLFTIVRKLRKNWMLQQEGTLNKVKVSPTLISKI